MQSAQANPNNRKLQQPQRDPNREAKAPASSQRHPLQQPP